MGFWGVHHVSWVCAIYVWVGVHSPSGIRMVCVYAFVLVCMYVLARCVYGCTHLYLYVCSVLRNCTHTCVYVCLYVAPLKACMDEGGWEDEPPLHSRARGVVPMTIHPKTRSPKTTNPLSFTSFTSSMAQCIRVLQGHLIG